MAGCCPTFRLGTACGNVNPASRSGLFDGLRYRVHQLVSTVSCIQVREPPDLSSSRSSTARQSSELIQIDWRCAVRQQIRVDESEVGHLVLSIVVNVLRHVFVEHLEGFGVFVAAGTPRDLAVLNAAEFVVLSPEIGFKDLGGRKKPQNCPVPCSERAALGKQPGLRCRGGRHHSGS